MIKITISSRRTGMSYFNKKIIKFIFKKQLSELINNAINSGLV